ncbi:thiamine phosphate synthase [Paenibacillus nasutitermitis]|uniref:thiamine phosphate synthase n=1 Tax=Paenibacillus nasutitermitis TaxID=1652958 RepID=UPI001E4F23D4|nr:thiamine phosphate synthase [Paenibacillus nasutitermitis]
MLELHIISDGQNNLDRFTEIAQNIHPYITAFHLREPRRNACELWQVVQAMLARGVPANKLMINDRIDVAWAAKLQGAQLSYRSLNVRDARAAFPGLRLGCSVHEHEEALLAEGQGADFLLYGHVFETASKPGQQPRGISALEQIAGSVKIPVIAIGGIYPDRVHEVVAAGAAGVAVLSGVTQAADPLVAVKKYAEALNKARRQ